MLWVPIAALLTVLYAIGQAVANIIWALLRPFLKRRDNERSF